MRPSVLYIGGVGRSGSTLLARLLSQLDGHVSVGELRYVWRRGMIENQLCECGEPFRACPFWSDVITDAFGPLASTRTDELAGLAARVDRIRHIPRLAVPALRSPSFQSQLDALGAALSRLYAAVLRVSGASVVVDSSKDPSYAYLLCAQPTLDVSVVHLVRDSRAVAYSWTRQKRRPEIHWRVEYMQRRSPLLSARRWNQYNLMFEFLARRTGRGVRVRYEDLVREPLETVAFVGALTGAPHGQSARCAHGAVGGHTMSGNPSRFDGPQPVVADTEWLQRMPSPDRWVVTAVTAPLLARYGYVSR